jgi:ABC-type lipoprotein release transport system permease subunit
VLGRVGIPGNGDQVQFLFSGPRLHPELTVRSFLFAFATVLVVSTFSSFYPAVLATRVTPLAAMESED